MPADRNPVRQTGDDLGDRLQQSLRIGHRIGRARLEHGAAVLIDELNTQPFRRLVDKHLLRQGGDVGIVPDGLMDRLGGMRKLTVFGG